jgi:hypothetical protein
LITPRLLLLPRDGARFDLIFARKLGGACGWLRNTHVCVVVCDGLWQVSAAMGSKLVEDSLSHARLVDMYEFLAINLICFV